MLTYELCTVVLGLMIFRGIFESIMPAASFDTQVPRCTSKFNALHEIPLSYIHLEGTGLVVFVVQGRWPALLLRTP